MKIKQHIPRFVDTGNAPEENGFNTTEELLGIPWVKKWTESDCFARFSVSYPKPMPKKMQAAFPNYQSRLLPLLMAEFKTGAYWVVGYLMDVQKPLDNLPKFVEE